MAYCPESQAFRTQPANRIWAAAHLDTALAFAAFGTLHSIAGFAAAVIAIHIGLAAVELCEGLVLVAAPAQLDALSRAAHWQQAPCLVLLAGRHSCCFPALQGSYTQVAPGLLLLLLLQVLVLLLLLLVHVWCVVGRRWAHSCATSACQQGWYECPSIAAGCAQPNALPLL